MLLVRSVLDPAFKEYGQVITGYDFTELMEAFKKTPKSLTETDYVPSDPALEALPVAGELQNRYFGGLDIEIGYCNGTNTKLIGLEYHRSSELNLVETDTIFLIAKQSDIVDGKIDTSKVVAFLCPAGVAVEMYATTMHFAPCDAHKGAGFRCLVVLPKGTNTEMEPFTPANWEDKLLVAKNKWLFMHESLPFVKDGKLPAGLIGPMIDMEAQLD